MKKIMRVLLVFVLVLLSACGGATQAQTKVAWPFYKITKGEEEGYLLGTFHVGQKSYYPFPQEILDALENTDILMTEVKGSDMGSQETRDITTSILTTDKKLSERLDAENYAKLLEKCEEYNMKIETIDFVEVWYLPIVFQLVPMTKLSLVNTYGVDQALFNLQSKYKLQNVGFETVSEQFNIIKNAYAEPSDTEIIDSIPILSEATTAAEKLSTAYLTNDVETLKLGLEEAPKEIAEVRNQNWMPHIMTELSAKQKPFIAVGALHLLGEQGLIELLESQGYTVEFIDTVTGG